MKQMTLNDIQHVSLEILKEFHAFCISHNLRYSLDSGTLLGAIRHKGFIPWDDDIDIIMPRPDYNQFIALYKDNDKYACFAEERKNCFLAYTRLADVRNTYVKPAAVWATRDTGIWIDIFPIDGVESDKKEFSKTITLVKKTWRKACMAREAMGDFSYCQNFIKKVKLIPKKLLYRNAIYRFLFKQMAICHRFNYDSCEYIGYLSMPGAERIYFKRDIMDEYIEVDFESFKFKAIKSYDIYLTGLYGDYMQLPPEDKRIIHDMHHYFWK